MDANVYLVLFTALNIDWSETVLALGLLAAVMFAVFLWTIAWIVKKFLGVATSPITSRINKK